MLEVFRADSFRDFSLFQWLGETPRRMVVDHLFAGMFFPSPFPAAAVPRGFVFHVREAGCSASCLQAAPAACKLRQLPGLS
jgi:hypothetical protein